MFNRMVFGVDFTHLSSNATKAGMRLAEKCAKEIHLVHVITDQSQRAYFAAEGMEIDYHTKVHERHLSNLVAEQSHSPSNKRFEVLHGESVCGEILRFAREHNADLIVIGSHGRTAVGEVLLGSTTEELTRLSEIPVMILREPESDATEQMSFSPILALTDSANQKQILSVASRLARCVSAKLHVFGMGNEDPVGSVLKYIHEEDCRLIVMMTHGKTAVDRFLHGSVSREIVNKTHVPIIAIPSHG